MRYARILSLQKRHAYVDQLISDHAAWFYSIGGRKLSAEKVLYDLAAIKL